MYAYITHQKIGKGRGMNLLQIRHIYTTNVTVEYYFLSSPKFLECYMKKRGTQGKAEDSRLIYIESQTVYARILKKERITGKIKMMPPESNPLIFLSLRTRTKLVGLGWRKLLFKCMN
jgi:hypothetical protein